MIKKNSYLKSFKFSNIENLKEESIISIEVTEDLFDKVLTYTNNFQLNTSYFNHGKGVTRHYTVNYCLQENFYNSQRKYLIKRGGRIPQNYFKNRGVYTNMKKDFGELLNITPSFNSVCRNIARKYPNMIIIIHYSKDPNQSN